MSIPKYIVVLFFLLVGYGFGANAETRLPKELRKKWEGKVIVNNAGVEHIGNMELGFGALLAKSEYEVDFGISLSSISKCNKT